MKKPSIRPFFYVILSALTIILTGFSGYLYQSNIEYRKANRELIIQNDSIMSVNIELTRKLEGRMPDGERNSGIGLKTTKSK